MTSRRLLFRGLAVAVVGLTIIMPALSVMLCNGWTEGSMLHQTCLFGGSYMMNIADKVMGFLLVAAFLVGLPLLLYLAFIALVVGLLWREASA